MPAVYKIDLELAKKQAIKVPVGSTYLDVQSVGHDVYASWWLVPDPSAPKERKAVLMFRTGQEIDIPLDVMTHLGTIQVDNTAAHIFTAPVSVVMPGSGS